MKTGDELMLYEQTPVTSVAGIASTSLPVYLQAAGLQDGLAGQLSQIVPLAKGRGLLLEGAIPKPGPDRIKALELAGVRMSAVDPASVKNAVSLWLPDFHGQEQLVQALCEALEHLRRSGKDGAVLVNACCRYLCWIKDVAATPLRCLDEHPWVVARLDAGLYEHVFFSMLQRLGCRVLLLGKASGPALSQVVTQEGCPPFPADFRLADYSAPARPAPSAAPQAVHAAPVLQLGGTPGTSEQTATPRTGGFRFGGAQAAPEANTATVEAPSPAPLHREINQWINGKAGLRSIAIPPKERGGTDYTCFFRMNGVPDRLSFQEELLQLQRQLKKQERPLMTVTDGWSVPTPEEIARIHRANGYRSVEQAVNDLAKNLQAGAFPELGEKLSGAFAAIMAEDPAQSVPRTINDSVIVLCWLQRCRSVLFKSWKENRCPVLLQLGGCQNGKEARLLRILARSGVDVMILCPNGEECVLRDPELQDLKYPDKMELKALPTAGGAMETAAYRAQQEVRAMMGRRSAQSAVALHLTIAENELPLLWREPLANRPGYSAEDGQVVMPVIFAKLNGVDDETNYWAWLRQLVVKDATYVIRALPHLRRTDANPFRAAATGFLGRDNRLDRSAIQNHPAYQFRNLRKEMETHLLDCLQQLLDQGIIEGTWKNGTEYSVIAVALNLDRQLLHILQSFTDFGAKNPKLIIVSAGEEQPSQEDAILCAFLSLVGFDVLICTPTGYQSLERRMHGWQPDEFTQGHFVYDMAVPDFTQIKLGFWDRLLGRG